MELVKSVSIENVVGKRNGAVARLQGLFDIVDSADGDLAQLCGLTLTRIVGGARDCLLFDGQAGLDAAIKAIDANVWAKILLESGIRSFMASGDRERWDEKIRKHDVPEVTLENLRSTFSALYAARGEMFTDGVVAVFRSLSWDHKTNSPMAFGKKVIIANLWQNHGSYLNDSRCDVLDDLVRAMHLLDGKPEPDIRNGMRIRIGRVDRPDREWDEGASAFVQPAGADVLEDEYFKLRWFKKTGTAHVTFKRPDLVERMNQILGSRFPDALATDVRNPVNRPKAAPAPGLRRISSEVLQALRAMRHDGNRLVGLPRLDRQAYEEANRILASLGGRWVSGAKAHVFDGVPADSMPYLLTRILREGAYADPRDFGYFPSPARVVDELLQLAQLEPGMRVLEPSAGRGAIVRGLLDAGCRVRAVELMDSNVRFLRELDCSITQRDFLETHVSHETEGGLFDAVVMNPPFANFQDIAHVMHATYFLKPGGRLVSVMSAGVKWKTDRYSTQFREYVAQFGEFVDLPAGAFKESGTDVNTVIVVITKPDPSRRLAANEAVALLEAA